MEPFLSKQNTFTHFQVSGHLLSTAEIESALALHPSVVEAAVVSAPHQIKGHFPYAFVCLAEGKRLDAKLIKEMKDIVREKIGAIAIPDVVQASSVLWLALIYCRYFWLKFL